MIKTQEFDLNYSARIDSQQIPYLKEPPKRQRQRSRTNNSGCRSLSLTIGCPLVAVVLWLPLSFGCRCLWLLLFFGCRCHIPCDKFSHDGVLEPSFRFPSRLCRRCHNRFRLLHGRLSERRKAIVGGLCQPSYQTGKRCAEVVTRLVLD